MPPQILSLLLLGGMIAQATDSNTPESIEALSWMGRKALAAKQLDQAEKYAKQTQALALEQLKKRKLDAETHLPIALGAAIEVEAQVMAQRGERAEAVQFLKTELNTYRGTSIRARIQKNINLLTLEGKPAPALEMREFLGSKPDALSQLKGKPVVLFFWAHWCGDCKQQAPILANLQAQYRDKGLTIVGPTQRYGYTAKGEDADAKQETAYIDEVRKKYYGGLDGMPVPVSEANFKTYGASTTPTLVLVNRLGIVVLYHPGRMTQEELEPKVRAIAGS